jgi:pimeloyl-ACP methyl ester carboxylesterase
MVKSVLWIIGGLVLPAVLATGFWAWAPDRPRAELEAKYLTPDTRYVMVGGTSLRVRDTGPRDAPALLMLHGFGSSLETWTPWADSLSGHYRVVRFDLPGSGLSGPDRTGDYSDARSIALTMKLMDQLGIERAVLIGNSIGGRIAWRSAAAHADRVSKLVLISPDGFASPGFEYGKAPEVGAVLNLMRWFLPRSVLRMNLVAAYADPARLSSAAVDRYYDLLLAPGDRGAMLDRMRQTMLTDPVALLPQIKIPTLLMWGKKDRLIPFGNSADYLHLLPDVQLVAFEDLGHVPQEEAPAESLPALEKFLKTDR